MLRSAAFGEFDPLHPRTIPGLFAENLFAEPVLIEAPVELVWEVITDFDRYYAETTPDQTSRPAAKLAVRIRTGSAATCTLGTGTPPTVSQPTGT